eukprot:9844277-Lingulodinium_polyedra.AAC.1
MDAAADPWAAEPCEVVARTTSNDATEEEDAADAQGGSVKCCYVYGHGASCLHHRRGRLGSVGVGLHSARRFWRSTRAPVATG